MINWIQKGFRAIGIDLRRYPFKSDFAIARHYLFQEHGIDVVLDVGANIGQYAEELRGAGYRGKIISFEASSAAFEELSCHVESDLKWTCHHVAVGDSERKIELNISENSVSSSFLQVNPLHLKSAPDSRYVSKEMVEMASLDFLMSDLVGPNERVCLKLDIQGGEMAALNGAGKLLSQVVIIESELSFETLYEGQPLFGDMIEYLNSASFGLVAFSPAFRDPKSGRILQCDGIFVRGK